MASILLFFLIYWVLPYRKVPARAVLPTAIVIGLLWEVAKHLYVRALPWLDFQAVYGPFYISVGLMMWAFLSGLLLLAGAHFSATRYTLRLARQARAGGEQRCSEPNKSRAWGWLKHRPPRAAGGCVLAGALVLSAAGSALAAGCGGDVL